jgi:hypothetical protein
VVKIKHIHLEPEHLLIKSISSLTQLSHPLSHGEDLMISSSPGKVLGVNATSANFEDVVSEVVA